MACVGVGWVGISTAAASALLSTACLLSVLLLSESPNAAAHPPAGSVMAIFGASAVASSVVTRRRTTIVITRKTAPSRKINKLVAAALAAHVCDGEASATLPTLLAFCGGWLVQPGACLRFS